MNNSTDIQQNQHPSRDIDMIYLYIVAVSLTLALLLAIILMCKKCHRRYHPKPIMCNEQEENLKNPENSLKQVIQPSGFLSSLMISKDKRNLVNEISPREEEKCDEDKPQDLEDSIPIKRKVKSYKKKSNLVISIPQN